MAPVLILEDDADSLLLYELYLASAGIPCVPLRDGAAAAAALAGVEPFAALLLDLNVPGTNPDEFVARLRALPHRAALPVVVVSGADDIAERASAMGAEAFVRKPVKIDALLGVVRGLASP